MKKNKETKKLKEGEEVIFSDGKTLMEKVKVESIDKKGGFAILSNKVKVSRTLGPDGYYARLMVSKVLSYLLRINRNWIIKHSNPTSQLREIWT